MSTIPASRNRKVVDVPSFQPSMILDQFLDTLMLDGYFHIFLTDESN